MSKRDRTGKLVYIAELAGDDMRGRWNIGGANSVL